MDNSGMGGDLVVTANVSTISCFIAAAGGIYVCKHGSPANADKGRHGSSDFIELCGLEPKMSKAEVEVSVRDLFFGFTEALDTRFKRIHTQTHHFAKLPHMNDIIGPITNPVHPSLLRRRVIGVNHLVSPAVVAEAYKILNSKNVTQMERVVVVRGKVSSDSTRGMDEVSICEGGTEVAELSDGVIYTYHLQASDFGIVPVAEEDISPPSGLSKGAFSMKILHGEERGPALRMVLANAGLLFRLHDESLSLDRAYRAAQDVFETGKVPDVIEGLRTIASR
jgi:anthranilate phosphoribosyltransferase